MCCSVQRAGDVRDAIELQARKCILAFEYDKTSISKMSVQKEVKPNQRGTREIVRIPSGVTELLLYWHYAALYRDDPWCDVALRSDFIFTHLLGMV
jgi:hypothetical protein